MPEIDLHLPRSVGEIIDLAVIGHRRHPVVFFTLTLSVVVPYTLIVWAATGATQITGRHLSERTAVLVATIGLALIGPLISVLHVHALRMYGSGERPTLIGVYRAALPVLPVAAAAQIVAGLGIFASLFAVIFVIPGLFLLVRAAVAPQVAAIERTDWLGAVRTSFGLTTGRGLHTLATVLVASIFEGALVLAGTAVAGTHTHVQQVVLAIVVSTIGQSFNAIVTALLYFDLRARAGSEVA